MPTKTSQRAAVFLCLMSLMSFAATSDAAQILYHPSNCRWGTPPGTLPVNPGDLDPSNDSGQMVNYQTSSTDVGILVCPLQRITNNLTAGTVTAKVWQNGTNAILARACLTSPSGGGGICGPGASATGTGIKTLSTTTNLNVSCPDCFWSLQFRMTGCIGSGCNALFGYTHN